MQAETHKAAGLQHKQANTQDPDTPLPHDTTTVTDTTADVVPEGLEQLYAAIHGDLGERHMTWIK